MVRWGSSVLVTGSKALVPSSDALVPSSFLLLVYNHWSEFVGFRMLFAKKHRMLGLWSMIQRLRSFFFCFFSGSNRIQRIHNCS